MPWIGFWLRWAVISAAVAGAIGGGEASKWRHAGSLLDLRFWCAQAKVAWQANERQIDMRVDALADRGSEAARRRRDHCRSNRNFWLIQTIEAEEWVNRYEKMRADELAYVSQQRNKAKNSPNAE